MTPREMQHAFTMLIETYSPEFEIDSKPDSYTIFHWLNVAQLELVKQRYSGNNMTRESFEETQERTDELRTLVRNVGIVPLNGVPGSIRPNTVIATLPQGYMFAVGEEVYIEFPNPLDGGTTQKRTGVTHATSDTIIHKLNNPYSEHRLHYEEAKPLRIFTESFVELTTDGTYTIPYYHLRYIKTPNQIFLPVGNCELPEHLHQEVVRLAVHLFVNSIGASRYQQPQQVEQNTNE